MKTLTSYSKLIYCLYLPLIFLLACIAYFAPVIPFWATSLSYSFIIILILFLLSPFSKQLINKSSPTNKYSLLKIISLQLGLLFIILSVIIMMNQWIAIPMNHPHRNLQQMLTVSMDTMLCHWGLFPWSLYAIVAITIAYIGKDKQPPLLANIFKHCLKNKSGTLAMGGEIFARQSIIFGLSFTLGMISLAGYIWLSKLLGLTPHINLNITSLLLLVVILMLNNTTLVRKSLHYLWKRKITTGQLLLLNSLIAMILLILLNPMLVSLAATLNLLNLDPMLSHWQSQQWLIPWQLFFWAWLVAITPLVAPLLAKCIQGMSIRRAIIYLLLFPIILNLVWLLPDINHGDLFPLLQTKWFSLVLPCVGLGLVCLFSYKSKLFDKQLTAHTYKSEKNKDRVAFKMARGCILVMLVLILVYQFLGLYFFSIYFFAVVATCYVVYMAFCRSLFHAIREVIAKENNNLTGHSCKINKI